MNSKPISSVRAAHMLQLEFEDRRGATERRNPHVDARAAVNPRTSRRPTWSSVRGLDSVFGGAIPITLVRRAVINLKRRGTEAHFFDFCIRVANIAETIAQHRRRSRGVQDIGWNSIPVDIGAAVLDKLTSRHAAHGE